jgi:hypothetical protein
MAVCDANGQYTFAKLPAGAYRVRIGDTSGRAETTGLLAVTARPGQTAYANFGVTTAARVHGVVFHDAEVNSVFDAGDPPLKGWVVWSDLDGNEQPDGFEPATRTGPDGAYELILPAGANHLMTQLPTGRRFTLKLPDAGNIAAGTDLAADIGSTDKSYIRANVYLTGDGDPSAGKVYLDLNNNAKLDADEPSYSAQGAGTFENLTPGTYWLRLVSPGALWTVGEVGSGGFKIKVSAGSGVGRAFSLTAPGALEGIVYNDVNQNQTRGRAADEPGIAGATLFDDVNHNNTLDPGELQTQTKADGSYHLDVPARGHRLVLINKTGWRTVDSVNQYDVEVEPTATVTTHFPMTKTARIRTIFYEDFNGNHHYDQYEEQYAGSTYADLNNNSQFEDGEPQSEDWYLQIVEKSVMVPGAGTYHIRVLEPYSDATLISPTDGFTVTIGDGTVTTVYFETHYSSS